ncbi:MAG: phage portal protein [Acuticoccus sp.]
MNIFDRAVALVSPERALARQRARAALAAMERYEAARANRRTRGWATPSTDATTATRGDLHRLRDVSRDLVRNNAWAQRGVSVVANNTIGAGIIPQVRQGDGAPHEELEALARAWADTTACDADGRHDLYGLQLQAMRCIVESGEVLIRRRWRRGADGLALPMQLQVLEPDHLDPSADGARGARNVVQGVEFDAIGRRVAYFVRETHPGSFGRHATSRRIPAEEIIHVYRVDRPGQVRGVPWLAPIALRLNDFRDYEDAQLVRQKIAACYAAFVHMPIDVEAITDAPAGADLGGEAGSLQQSFEPGMIERLPPGWQVQIANPPKVDGYTDYTAVTLRAIAAGLGVSYEALSGDLSQVNFSSARMGWLEFQRNIDVWRWGMLAPTMLNRLGAWFLEASSQVLGPSADAQVVWTPPRREMVNPADEVPALVDMIRAGFTSRSEIIRSYGYDPTTVMDEIEADTRDEARRGLAFETSVGGRSPAATAPSPAPTAPPAPDSGNPE